MEKKVTLKVKLLGGLKITNGKVEFPYEKKRSAQVDLLIVFLIINRNKSITNLQLIDYLWPNGNSDKPEGALRNLVYRARKEMKQFFEDSDCIKSKGRRYFWNLDVGCKVDYEDLLKLCNKVEKENDPHQKYEICLDLIAKYHGEILPELNYNDWVMDINNTLSRNCMEAILNTLLVLANHNQYEEILQICNHQNCLRLMDMRLYEIQLYAYYKTNKIDIGLSFYRKVVDYYYSKYGIGVSHRLKEIYEMLLDTSSSTQIGVEELEKSLACDNNEENTFYCDFDVFKNIYQINIRSARRSMKARILALLTIIDTSNSLDEKSMNYEADILRDVISNSLRKNDVFSKFNMTQYSLILASPDLEGAQIAVNRITSRYNEKKKHDQIILVSDLKKIR
ncbi:AfsR/SARP family transcriptional regulator [Thomasclavelia sp.]